MTTGAEFDVAVIGGGLVGSCLALGLARLGRRVGLFDEGDAAPRASRANFALVWVQSKGLGMPEYAGWTIRSSEAWAEFAAGLRQECGLDVAFERPGGFHLGLSEAELSDRADALRRELFDWLAAVEKSESEEAAPVFDPLMRRQLQGLGYME